MIRVVDINVIIGIALISYAVIGLIRLIPHDEAITTKEDVGAVIQVVPQELPELVPIGAHECYDNLNDCWYLL